MWLGALRIKSCLNSATYFVCASRAGETGFCAWVRVCEKPEGRDDRLQTAVSDPCW